MRQNLNALIIGIAIILTGFIIAGAYKYKFRGDETITVTGLAEKNFTSDLIVWEGDYSRKMPDLKTAYQLLKKDEATIRSYLKSKGLNESELLFSSVDITKSTRKIFDPKGVVSGEVFDGYELKQSVTVKSKEIDKIEKISREVTELIEDGIEVNSLPPSYYYTNLAAIKIDLLAKASADAKLRAETIAQNSGGNLGSVRQANMGVFQITGDHDNESYAGGGAFNTSSRNKTASITIRVDYLVH